MREINQNARQAVSAAEKERTAREEEEMARLLEGLVLQQARKEEELAKRFVEREKKLWAVSHRERAVWYFIDTTGHRCCYTTCRQSGSREESS